MDMFDSVLFLSPRSYGAQTVLQMSMMNGGKRGKNHMSCKIVKNVHHVFNGLFNTY